MSSVYAVLSGDIVESSRLSGIELQAVRDRMQDAVRTIRSWRRGRVRGSLAFYRGDAWQLLLADPCMALRAAVYLRARVRAVDRIDTRVAIGVGRVDRIARVRVSHSVGEAFTASGHALDAMTRYYRLDIALARGDANLGRWLHTAALLCDALIRRWTARQSEIVAVAADPAMRTHADVSRELGDGTTRQAVSKSLQAADWYSLSQTLECFEQTDWETVE